MPPADVSIVSSSSTGMAITMNAFVAPADQAAYLEVVKPVMKAFRENPENLFVAVSINPTDAGHVRIVHGWKRDSQWFHETFIEQPYFQEFVEKTKGMWVKPRVIEHFDLVPTE